MSPKIKEAHVRIRVGDTQKLSERNEGAVSFLLPLKIYLQTESQAEEEKVGHCMMRGGRKKKAARRILVRFLED